MFDPRPDSWFDPDEPVSRIEVKCAQCGKRFLEHPNVKRTKGVCSEGCRKARNIRKWLASHPSPGEQREEQ